jgi:tetratricopeptide (TPR) repeat protein
MGEIDADPKMALSEVKDAFPSIPNLSTSTLPIPALVARYYYRDKMYDEALALLNASEKINPYLYYTDFIKTAVYASKNNVDSVSFYANRAFFNWPRATSYYKNAIFAASRKKDTAAINKAFTTYVKYRNHAEAWNQYLLGRLELHGPSNALTLQLFDSAIKQFPKDTAVFKKLIDLLAQSGAQNVVALSTNYSAKGMQAFVKGNYQLAAKYYMQASAEDRNNYTHLENVGICFYSDKQFDKAITYFDQAIILPTENTGKSEFYKAMCLISLGKKEQACAALQQAKAKNYPGTDSFITANCK